MPYSKRTINNEVIIRFDDDGHFRQAERKAVQQALEDGAVFAERRKSPQFLTLAQLKALVAAL